MSSPSKVALGGPIVAAIAPWLGAVGSSHAVADSFFDVFTEVMADGRVIYGSTGPAR